MGEDTILASGSESTTHWETVNMFSEFTIKLHQTAPTGSGMEADPKMENAIVL